MYVFENIYIYILHNLVGLITLLSYTHSYEPFFADYPKIHATDILSILQANIVIQTTEHLLLAYHPFIFYVSFHILYN